MIPPFHTLTSFSGLDKTLAAVLGKLEANIRTWAESVRREARPRWNVTQRITPTEGSADHPWPGKPGDLLRADTTAGDVYISMPAASPENAGQEILVRTYAAVNNVNVLFGDGNVEVMAAAASGADAWLWMVSAGIPGAGYDWWVLLR